MSKNRFLFLLAALRFDDASTRDERKETDPLAGISPVLIKLVTNSQSNYTCGQYTKIDAMLVPFRGRCKFRIYKQNKPAKYELKVLVLCDAQTHYFVNGFIHSGKTKEPNPNKLYVPTLTVLSLIEPIANSNRRITADNWFSEIELLEQLKLEGLT
ncbi:hypothetical protein PR048_021650 [Dryococelus australis]|uniref:PiggyBac transposable element-derived protein domain-containing protein n=1 Tax=Dryococelus australis TaxID=614101 RepID=A0ABQ9GYV7_9NEOP|nr:hypothetical protein PR048_021650 [Dryococelus australis]